MSCTWNQLQKKVREKTRQYRVLVIDGLIGAGKSTVLESLRQKLGLNVRYIREPSDIWESLGALRQFYSDPQRYGVEFQVLVTATRVQSCIDAVSENKEADLYILERSPLTDRAIFMEIQRSQMSPVSFSSYEMWWEIQYKSLPFDLSEATVIFLRPSMESIMDRVKTRARAGEIVENKDEIGIRDDKEMTKGGVSIEYQEMLLKAHDAFLLGKNRDLFPKMMAFPGSPDQVTVLDGNLANQDFRQNAAGQDDLVQFVRQVIEKRWPELFVENSNL